MAWSCSSIAGVPLDKFPGSKDIDREAMANETKKKASALIESKGNTEFGIASVASSICKSILFDQRNIRPISHYQEDLKVCLSKPVILGRKGLAQTVELPLSGEEREALERSAKSLREVIEEAEKAEKEG